MTGKHQVTNGTVILVNGDIYKVIVVSDLLSQKKLLQSSWEFNTGAVIAWGHK